MVENCPWWILKTRKVQFLFTVSRRTWDQKFADFELQEDEREWEEVRYVCGGVDRGRGSNKEGMV